MLEISHHYKVYFLLIPIITSSINALEVRHTLHGTQSKTNKYDHSLASQELDNRVQLLLNRLADVG